jgi:hypothetical protein
MDSKLHQLLQTAVEKTARGGLRWKAFDDESFRAPIHPGYLHIHRGSTRIEGDDGEMLPAATYSIQISDGMGRVVAEEGAVEGGQDQDFPLLHNLFRAARTSALGGYQVIENMLSHLQLLPSD